MKDLTRYIGIPYSSKGRSFESLDCYGLVFVFYREELGIDVPDYLDSYESATSRASVSTAIRDNLPNWKPVVAMEYGDLLVFDILGLPIHVGVYLGDNQFLHAFQRTDSCIERLNSITWSRRLVGAFRWQQN